MVDPLGVVTAILTVAHLIRSAASRASQNKDKCLELAERAKNLADILPNFANAAASDTATARVLERLQEAVQEALRRIESCKSAGLFSGKYSRGKAAELDSVDKRINNCIMDLSLNNQARTNNGGAAAAAGKVPAQSTAHVDYHSSCYQAQGGGASTAYAAWPPTPQHAWGTPQPHPQGYYHQPPGYAHWVPGPAHYPASPAPSGSNLSSLYTLPTVNKVLKRVFR